MQDRLIWGMNIYLKTQSSGFLFYHQLNKSSPGTHTAILTSNTDLAGSRAIKKPEYTVN